MVYQGQTAVLYKMLMTIWETKGKSFRPMSEMFQDLPSKKELPDYYEQITTPMSLKMIKDNLDGKNPYPDPQKFKEDMKLVFANARAYNRKNSLVYKDATKLENMFKGLWSKAIESGDLDAKEETPPPAEMPEPVSIASPSTPVASADTPSKRNRGRKSLVDDIGAISNLSEELEVIYDKFIHYKNEDARVLSTAFQSLPVNNTDYYDVIKRPMALELVRRKMNAHEYTNKLQFEQDMVLMLTNARKFHGIATQMYADAAQLQVYLMELIYGKISTDEKYARADRAAVSEILIHGEPYRMGDWIHCINPNDPQKPIVAQIFKPWRHEDGTYFVYACWYYFPEQTVHQASRMFLEHEVFKTGHFHDHPVQEVLEKCYVMFITKYNKGRPRSLGDRKLYVCESRYSESQKSYTKIKSWNSCIPEELRGTDEDLEYFNAPITIRKVPSPYAPKNGMPAPMMQESEEVMRSRGRPPRAPQTPGGPMPGSPWAMGSNFNGTPTSMYNGGTPNYPMPVGGARPAAPIPAPPFGLARPGTISVNQAQAHANAPGASAFLAGAPQIHGLPEMAEDVAKRFTTDDDGKVLWFATPPADVVREAKLMHSLEYLERKAAKEGKKRTIAESAGQSPPKRVMLNVTERGLVLEDAREQEAIDALEALADGWRSDATALTNVMSA